MCEVPRWSYASPTTPRASILQLSWLCCPILLNNIKFLLWSILWHFIIMHRVLILNFLNVWSPTMNVCLTNYPRASILQLSWLCCPILLNNIKFLLWSILWHFIIMHRVLILNFLNVWSPTMNVCLTNYPRASILQLSWLCCPILLNNIKFLFWSILWHFIIMHRVLILNFLNVWSPTMKVCLTNYPWASILQLSWLCCSILLNNIKFLLWSILSHFIIMHRVLILNFLNAWSSTMKLCLKKHPRASILQLSLLCCLVMLFSIKFLAR